MDASFEKSYHDNEKQHFWFRARREALLKRLRNFSKKSLILDIGCSSGLLIEDLISCGHSPDCIYGIDISSKAINNCRNKGLLNVFVDDAQNPKKLKEKFDVIIASDCLEHLEDDSKAINEWRKLLKKGGELIIFVPAFQFLWSEHDELNFHYRRYTLRQLEDILKKEGLQIGDKGYWNTFLFFPISVFRILKNVVNKFFPKKKSEQQGDISVTPVLNRLFLGILKLENKILYNHCLPFGVSVYCVSRK